MHDDDHIDLTDEERRLYEYANMRPHYLPTPREIREGCELLQLQWSDRERAARSGRRHSDYVLPGTELLP